MRTKCLAQGHHCRCKQIRMGDLTVESPWCYPLSHNSSKKEATHKWASYQDHQSLSGRRISTNSVYMETFNEYKKMTLFDISLMSQKNTHGSCRIQSDNISQRLHFCRGISYRGISYGDNNLPAIDPTANAVFRRKRAILPKNAHAQN